jgi:hypothetical protein
MNLFIDTNIFIDFYEATAESLVELEKLHVVIRRGGITLWLPDQVQKEFWKHRETAIEKHLAKFAGAGGMGDPPCLVKEDPEFRELTKLLGAQEKKRSEIVARIRQEVLKEETRADRLVRALFSEAKKIETDTELFAAAHERALRHLPPGKTDGLGDRLCWVALLKAVPANQSLSVLSGDGDYSSEANADTIASYLCHEWRTKKGSEVMLWRRMSQFMAAKFPDAKTAMEVEHSISVEALSQSPNFMRTHRLIAEFNGLESLSPALADKLAGAILNNPQINWIIRDDDVREFVRKFLKWHGAKIDANLTQRIETELATGYFDCEQLPDWWIQAERPRLGTVQSASARRPSLNRAAQPHARKGQGDFSLADASPYRSGMTSRTPTRPLQRTSTVRATTTGPDFFPYS